MPQISRFFGIVIYMYAKDHLPPHFHAIYGEEEAMVDIKTGEIMKGHLGRRALRLVQEWAELHPKELLENWKETQNTTPDFKQIEPLK